MSNIRFVGDIHGEYLRYLKVTDDTPGRVVQIGDFGLGFGLRGKADYVDKVFESTGQDHRFIRGNHDDPAECAKSTRWIKDGTVDEDGIMYIGGAASIDRVWRTPGVDWWFDEELSYEELEEITEKFKSVKPDVLVTHECPETIARDIMIPAVNGIKNFPSKTRSALDEMYKHHRPDLHIFGHWHKHVDVTIDGTRFMCLPILGTFDLEV